MHCLLLKWRPKSIAVEYLKSATTLDRVGCPWPLWIPGMSSLLLLLSRDILCSTVLGSFGCTICSHLSFWIGFGTVGNSSEQFIFFSHAVHILSPLGMERKSLTGRQLPVNKKKNPNVSQKSVVGQLQEEKQQKKDIWDEFASRDNIWDKWLPTNTPECATGTRSCHIGIYILGGISCWDDQSCTQRFNCH